MGINTNNSSRNLKVILAFGLVFVFILSLIYAINSWVYSFIPPKFESIYLLYAAIVSSVAFSSISLKIISSKKSDKKTPINYLKDTNKELNEVANKSESILNAIGDGVVLIDNENTIKLLNPAAAQILGWEIEDTIGLNYNSVLKLIDDKEAEISAQSSIIQQSIDTNSEVRPPTLTMKTKNDKKILVSLVASPIGTEGQGVIVVFRDVTKEKAEEREQAEFISTASHEMRTPVASIEGYLGLVLNPATATIDARAADYIQKAQSSAKHLGSLFQDLLDISRADDNRLSNNPQRTDIAEFTKNIVEDLKIKAQEKGLSLTFKPSSTTSTTMTKLQPMFYSDVDQSHLRELISNLTENAIKYTHQGGVTVDITGDSDHVVISVADTGIGIPSEDIPHLFQKFYRVDNKETNDIGGTGLGLYLVRKLAEVLNGRVWVESEYGQGTTFFIEIPRSTSNTPVSTQQVNQPLQTTQIIDTPVALAPAPPQIAQPTPQPTSPMSNYTVPRGEVLTQEQKAAYVAKLTEMSQNRDQ